MSGIDIETFDLTQLPNAEDDYFEFKSSATSWDDLKKKLNCAVSGFANSGGGCFVAGVDSNGNADGGFSLKKGRQDLRDWADQIINEVEPSPSYEIKLIQDSTGRGIIQPNAAVLLVYIHESYAGPHMASDKHYYIRAGAHTVKAKHFIVDAIWAKRHFSKPRLTHLVRLKPEKGRIVQIGILTLTDAPAVDVTITLSPLPPLMQNFENHFPLRISVIDHSNPFFFDIAAPGQLKSQFEENTYLQVDYFDLAANRYTYKTPIEITGSLPPLSLEMPDKMIEALQSVEKTLSRLIVSRERGAKPSLLLPKQSENVYPSLENLIPELLEDMKSDLSQYPLAREFIILGKGWQYNEDPNNMVLEYYFEDHPYLRNKLRILENYALIYEITYNNTSRFVITEELAVYLMGSLPE